MKSYKLIYPLIAVCMLLGGSCDEFEYKAAAPYEGKFDLTVDEFVTERFDSLQMLNDALRITGLAETIEAGQYTIFAPYNSGFKSYLDDNDYQSLADVPVDELTTLVSNHIIPGKRKASSFSPTGDKVETLSGKVLDVSSAPDNRGSNTAYVVIVDRRTILTSNIELHNVVLHAYQDDLIN